MKTIRVLVIDDEQIVLDSVRKILKGKDYEVDVSLGGRQGIDWPLKNNTTLSSLIFACRILEVCGFFATLNEPSRHFLWL